MEILLLEFFFFYSAPYFIEVSGEAAAVPGRVPAPRDR